MESLNPLEQIQLPLILAVMGIVVFTVTVMRRVFFTPYVDVMEEREVRLEAAEATLAEADRILAEAEPEAERIGTSSRERADAYARRLREEDDAYRQQVVETAMQESSRSLEQGRAKIGAARESEVTQLRDQAVECVTLACDKLLGSAEPEAVTAAVDKLLARRVH